MRVLTYNSSPVKGRWGSTKEREKPHVFYSERKNKQRLTHQLSRLFLETGKLSTLLMIRSLCSITDQTKPEIRHLKWKQEFSLRPWQLMQHWKTSILNMYKYVPFKRTKEQGLAYISTPIQNDGAKKKTLAGQSENVTHLNLWTDQHSDKAAYFGTKRSLVIASHHNFSMNVSVKVWPLMIFVVPTINSYAIPSCKENYHLSWNRSINGAMILLRWGNSKIL